MGFSSPKTPDAPAKKPEREAGVDPEDIELGVDDPEDGTDVRTQGKRALVKPTGGAAASGVKI
jgi:hypothetical protein